MPKRIDGHSGGHRGYWYAPGLCQYMSSGSCDIQGGHQGGPIGSAQGVKDAIQAGRCYALGPERICLPSSESSPEAGETYVADEYAHGQVQQTGKESRDTHHYTGHYTDRASAVALTDALVDVADASAAASAAAWVDALAVELVVASVGASAVAAVDASVVALLVVFDMAVDAEAAELLCYWEGVEAGS